MMVRGQTWYGVIIFSCCLFLSLSFRACFDVSSSCLTHAFSSLVIAGHKGYRPRRDGERKRKAIRGCIVDTNLSVLACTIIKKGDQEIAGLTGEAGVGLGEGGGGGGERIKRCCLS